MKPYRLSAILGAALCLPSIASAAQVRVEIYWSGAEPSISLDGTQPLQHDRARQVFHTVVEVAGNVPQRRTFIVSYGSFNHPIDVRLQPIRGSISFLVSHQPGPSCTDNRVASTERHPTTLPDAVNRSIAAGQLLSIESPNDCGDELELRAARARYQQNVRMSELSRGRFLVNPQIATEYDRIARQMNVPVVRQLAENQFEEATSEAVQLATARDAALAIGDFALAEQVNAYALARLRSSQGVRELFRRRGVTENNLLGMQARIRTLQAERAR